MHILIYYCCNSKTENTRLLPSFFTLSLACPACPELVEGSVAERVEVSKVPPPTTPAGQACLSARSPCSVARLSASHFTFHASRFCLFLVDFCPEYDIIPSCSPAGERKPPVGGDKAEYRTSSYHQIQAKIIICQARQSYEHLNFGNLNLFRI